MQAGEPVHIAPVDTSELSDWIDSQRAAPSIALGDVLTADIPLFAAPSSSSAEAPVDCGLPVGTLSAQELCDWICTLPSSIANTAITDVSWWAENRGLKHQFILLRIPNQTSVYTIRLERAGRTIWDSRAIDKATISLGDPFIAHPEFIEDNMLFCALLSADCAPLFAATDQWPKAPYFVFSGRRVWPAFNDFLDHKWRGPPLRLCDLARYLQLLIDCRPRYRLTGANCLWFARNLVHILALRHYSFPFVAFGYRPVPGFAPSVVDFVLRPLFAYSEDALVWRRHDPSTIGLLFRFLHYQERDNGRVMFRRAILIAVIIFATAAGVPAVIFLSLAITNVLLLRWPNSFILPVLSGWASFPLVLVIYFLSRWATHTALTLLTHWTVRMPTAALVRALDRQDGAHPRGEFLPPHVPLRLPHIARVLRPLLRVPDVLLAWLQRSLAPRLLPEPWEAAEQIYAPAMEEYWMALEEMRNAPNLAEDDLDSMDSWIASVGYCFIVYFGIPDDGDRRYRRYDVDDL
ncbi:hypothetical protein B0H13DRAFT_126792 [Mycena leptocephala]|nr:hypothetical protein B0H13DRAFT_126792 [Mycena leptocephala]